MVSPLAPSPDDAEEYRQQLARAKLRAFRFKTGHKGMGGLTKFYVEARKLARFSAPAIMNEMIQLALTAEDERVKSVCGFAVLDRAGIRPIDFDPSEEKSKPKFSARDYSAEELDLIEAALRVIIAKSEEKERRAGALQALTAPEPAEPDDGPVEPLEAEAVEFLPPNAGGR
jgi:hypothetical protein